MTVTILRYYMFITEVISAGGVVLLCIILGSGKEKLETPLDIMCAIRCPVTVLSVQTNGSINDL